MIIDIFLPLSLIFIMFSLGLGLTIENFKDIFKKPKSFMIGLLNQMLILPVIAFLIVSIFGLKGELAVGFMILSCCPGGVTSNILSKIAGGDTALSISLTAIVSILTVLTLPIIVGCSVSYFMSSNLPNINILSLGLTMFSITTIPVIAGLYVNKNFHIVSVKFSNISNKLSTLLFVVIIFGALASEWAVFIDNLFIIGPSIVSLITIMLFIGFLSSNLFKVSKNRAITIAIESSIQNATVGITIGAIISTSNYSLSVFSLPSAVYGILMYLICMPFIYIYVKLNKIY